MAAPTFRSVLACLTKARLLDVAAHLDVALSRAAAKDDQVEALSQSRPSALPDVLAFLLRDELKAICRAHDLDDGGRARAEIAERILSAVGASPARPRLASSAPAPAAPADLTLPSPGDIAVVRHRQY
jgi:type I restriction enzyme M protein